MNPDDLKARECNHSMVHIDIPFGSPEVDIIATTTDRHEVTLLDRGTWAPTLF